MERPVKMDFARARANMIESQIRPNRVTDPRILAAFGAVPREAFVPEQARDLAYCDEDVPLGNGRFLMEPMVMARLLTSAAVTEADTVLIVGTGTGYGAAVAARLASTVIAVEKDPVMAATANANLASLDIDNVAVLEGALERGCPEQAPFDVILFDGAVRNIPAAIEEQLADGGRLAAVVRSETAAGKAFVVTRHGGGFSRRPVFDAAIPLLPGFDKEPGFVF